MSTIQGNPVQVSPSSSVNLSRAGGYAAKLITAGVMIVVLLMITSLLAGRAWAQGIERRQEQFKTDFAYLIFPAPYSLPGIGSGFFMLGFVSNIFETTADIYAYKIFGDATGYGYGGWEVPIIPESLFFTVGGEHIEKGQINLYDFRGMNTKKDDYVLGDFQNYNGKYADLTLSLFERRLELHYVKNSQSGEVAGLRDVDGNVLVTFDPPSKFEGESKGVAMQVDYTDDFFDPREGVRFAMGRNLPDGRNSSAEPEFYVLDIMLNGYIPMGGINTLVFDYFRSKAIVSNTGDLDPASVALKYCAPGDAACIAQSQGLINSDLAHNQYGTASSLGGRDRLRAYPGDRFQGAHSEYLGVEFRWNFSEKVTPFDFWIWKDTRTGMQIAFIAETGSVAETADQLWDQSRSDFGVGFRMVTASGAVYRADFLSGDEGTELTTIVNYPW